LSALIRGEIAEIIDEYTVVLNIGRNAGVKKGMNFVVYAETGRIFDKSGDDLGILEIPKAEIEVKDVQEKLSIAESTAVQEIRHPLAPFAYEPIRVRSKLEVNADQIKRIEVDLKIKKGDKVRQVP